jgi:RNA polymerase sporulation-specific sigma factor
MRRVVGHLEELLNRYLNGDSQAGEGLLSHPQYHQRVERIARRITKGTSVAWEDAAQDAHEKVIQALRNRKFYNGGVKEFYCWTAAVAYHQILDLVRREKRQQGLWNRSLEQQIPGTDILLGETIADDLDLWDAVERADLLSKAVAAILTIDQRYPSQGYLKLWQDRMQGRTQSQVAAELGVTQGKISKRWQALIALIAEELGLLRVEDVQQNLKVTRQKRKEARRRSDTRW